MFWSSSHGRLSRNIRNFLVSGHRNIVSSARYDCRSPICKLVSGKKWRFESPPISHPAPCVAVRGIPCGRRSRAYPHAQVASRALMAAPDAAYRVSVSPPPFPTRHQSPTTTLNTSTELSLSPPCGRARTSLALRRRVTARASGSRRGASAGEEEEARRAKPWGEPNWRPSRITFLFCLC